MKVDKLKVYKYINRLLPYLLILIVALVTLLKLEISFILLINIPLIIIYALSLIQYYRLTQEHINELKIKIEKKLILLLNYLTIDQMHDVT